MSITFIVSGYTNDAPHNGAPLELPAGLTEGTVKYSVQVAVRRGTGSEVSLNVDPDKDVMAVHIANGPVLILNPETARELFHAQQSAASRDAQVAGNVRIPVQLTWDGQDEIQGQSRGPSRGPLGKVLVRLIQIITGVGKDTVADAAATLASNMIDKQVDPGLYKLDSKMLGSLKGSATATDIAINDKPLLVLLHGTFSSTHGTFGKLWTVHPSKVERLFGAYSGVYALDHPTLTASPIQNAMELANALPKGANLHLLSHSRGGLIGEVLAKVCSGGSDLLQSFEDVAKGDEYKAQREDLQQLINLVNAKGIKVTRFVRVACPARGTLLASNRLDAYLSVLKWSMDLSGVPVVPELVDLMAEVARRRSNPLLIPGLAAQMPDSPLVQWLHLIHTPVDGELRVIAGDMEGDSVVSWLKTLLSDTFFWTDNDLVVQTSSMYGGAPRARSAMFLLNQGGSVSHFSYFNNERTATAIVEGLTLDDPRDFTPIGPLSWQGTDSGGLRGGGGGKPAVQKPAVFILPGILGSNLKAGDRRIWLGPRLINGLDELSYEKGSEDNVEPDGAVGMVYEDLIKYLEATHEVSVFAFDWRVPMELEAERLGIAVENALNARTGTRQPVRMLAHSMGGLLARTMLLRCPQVWSRMMADPQARLLMLGTPNGGSWAPMQVLSGDDTFGNSLAFIGAPFSPQKSRKLMATFPGFIQLQANLLDPVLNLSDTEAWAELARKDKLWLKAHSFWHNLHIQQDYYDWGVPGAEVLETAKALRKALDEQDLSRWRDKLSMVVGEAQFTPDGYTFSTGKGFVYKDTIGGGDGRVTLHSALLPGVQAYKLDCEHGDLPKQVAAFPAFLSLLQTGRTTELAVLGEAISRGVVPQPSLPYIASRPVRGGQFTLPVSVDDIFTLNSQLIPSVARESLPPLPVTVINSNLKFTRDPLIVGHYSSVALTGSERVVDEMVGGLLNDALKMSLYPSSPRSNQVFMNIAVNSENPLQLPRPEAVIVVGLGPEGKLKSSDLLETVRMGVVAWAQRIAEQQRGVPVQFEIAAALIGSGGIGMSPSQSAALIAQGVQVANLCLKQKDWPIVSHLHLTELYLDRATDAWRAVHALGVSRPKDFLVTPTIKFGTGWLRRPLEGGYRSARYDFISVVTQYDKNQQPVIFYTLDTRRARAEVRAQSTQVALLRELVSASSNLPSASKSIGQTLFKLLVPLEMDAYLGGTTEMQIEMDKSTAAIPWELLNTERNPDNSMAENPEPWAIRCKLLRKLRTENYREQVLDASFEANVLIIGEPVTDTSRYPRLPAARAEARAITTLMENSMPPGKVLSLIADDTENSSKVDAFAVTSALLAQDWRIVHIAGHGEPPLFEALPEQDIDAPTKTTETAPRMLDPRGVVLSNNIFLGPREMKSMRVVPELVFINCCYLGAIDPTQLLKITHLSYDRTRFAATVAEELIAIGVRCVVVAGWAVDDQVAGLFATKFYSQLLNGVRFIDAVASARREAWLANSESNTWAAFQCYGDPDWVFARTQEDANEPAAAPDQSFDSIASPQALVLALEIAIDDSRYKKIPKVQVISMIEFLESHFAQLWIEMGAVCEAFAQAWAEAGETERAIGWFERAIGANDGGASFKASEQLGDLMARRAWLQVNAAARESPRELSLVLNSARKQTLDATHLLTRVCKLQPTLGRISLCGTAYKRLAWIEVLANDLPAEKIALQKMEEYFAEAEQRAIVSDPGRSYEPALERVAAQLFIAAAASVEADILRVQTQLRPWVESSPDFQNVAGLILSGLYLALVHGKLKLNSSRLLNEFADLKRRVPAVLRWREVQMQVDFVLDRYKAKAGKAEQGAVSAFKEKMIDWVKEQD
ncbi:UNVERIFIED_ORG: CHAT domain-containing protein/pimeloyl-ACP methyl ester carboxylesterase [Buttiauxella agrestis ATCC 33320]